MGILDFFKRKTGQTTSTTEPLPSAPSVYYTPEEAIKFVLHEINDEPIPLDPRNMPTSDWLAEVEHRLLGELRKLHPDKYDPHGVGVHADPDYWGAAVIVKV